MTDGILLDRDGPRPQLRPLRHADHRRGARAQPEHRLHPRLPAPAAARTARPEGHHHLGDDRPGAVRRGLRRRADRRGVRPHLSGRGALPADRGRRGRASRARRSATRSTSCPPRAPATSWSSSPASARSATPRTLLAGRDRLEVLPLYARLSAAEQHRVFEPRPAGRYTRRVVLATNVAETSLTVPGIRYVIDPGTARISRYSSRHQGAAAADRADLAGLGQPAQGPLRPAADGICIRLYSEADFESRPAFTDPEILRTNLASVILQMAAIGLGDVPTFPFIDPPDARNIADGLTLLAELNAFTDGRITGLGRKLARLPVDPRIGRMILEADRNGCAREVLIIAAALSIQDPRERPADAQQAADAGPPPVRRSRLGLHRLPEPVGLPARTPARAVLVRVPPHVPRRVPELPARARMAGPARAAAEAGRRRRGDGQFFLSRTVRGARLPARRPALPDRDEGGACSPGRLAPSGPRAGRRPRAEYLGARGARFAIFPGSGLARKPPDWIVAAELVETSRRCGRGRGADRAGVGRAARRST